MASANPDVNLGTRGLDSDSARNPKRSSQHAKKTRSRSGCNTCRSRKVKCDERANGCGNCERLHLECPGYGRAATITGVSRKRTYRSCKNCRMARCKCSGERPECIACRESKTYCVYDDGPKSNPDAAANDVALLQSQKHAGDEETSTRTSPMPSRPEGSHKTPLSWLCSPTLPGPKHIRVLVMSYFQNFHPLRCFAFIHKPSMLQRLDEGPVSSLQESALIHIMCTLGAQFYALEHSDTVQPLSNSFILDTGSSWAKTAMKLLMENSNKLSVEGLMAAQLLYDYALRMANFSQAFILSAIMVRMAQALQINLEYSSDMLHISSDIDLSITTRECRRRLMWSCYTTDVLCGSGVDQLMMLDEKDIKIQLPCNDYNFFDSRAVITRSLSGDPLDMIPADQVPADLDENMGRMAFFVQQIEIRKRVLRYIKQLDIAKMPWLPGSEFARLSGELLAWYQSLPPNLRFTSSTIYMHKEASQLGALCLFHCAYHQTMCDLFRIGTPDLYKLRSAFYFPPEKAGFQRGLQWMLFKSARTLAAIIGEAERHGPGMIGDSWLPTIAYDSNRIMLFYLTKVADPVNMSKKDLILNTIPYLQSNVKALKTMRSMNVVADGLARAAEDVLDTLKVDSNNILPLPHVVLEDPYLARLTREPAPGTPAQSAPDYVLNPLSIYRMARNEIPERHEPETMPSRSNEDNTTLGGFNLSPSIGDYNLENGLSAVQKGPGSVDTGITVMPNLDMFIAPPSDLNWLTAEVVIGSGMNGEGILPWVETSQIGDAMFSLHSI